MATGKITLLKQHRNKLEYVSFAEYLPSVMWIANADC